MSRQQVKQFLNEVTENEELQGKLKEILDSKSEEELQSTEHVNKLINQLTEIAAGEGYDFTADEYRAVLASAHVNAKGELSEEELEHVAGGFDWGGFTWATFSAATAEAGCIAVSVATGGVPWGDGDC